MLSSKSRLFTTRLSRPRYQKDKPVQAELRCQIQIEKDYLTHILHQPVKCDSQDVFRCYQGSKSRFFWLNYFSNGFASLIPWWCFLGVKRCSFFLIEQRCFGSNWGLKRLLSSSALRPIAISLQCFTRQSRPKDQSSGQAEVHCRFLVLPTFHLLHRQNPLIHAKVRSQFQNDQLHQDFAD